MSADGTHWSAEIPAYPLVQEAGAATGDGSGAFPIPMASQPAARTLGAGMTQPKR